MQHCTNLNNSYQEAYASRVEYAKAGGFLANAVAPVSQIARRTGSEYRNAVPAAVIEVGT